ncbi:molybdopterin molybdenumtransferase MoeA [Ruegeria sp. HKCCD4884]|uniref:molybdopterin molybdotransferase MoeA n=1 Tax=Ruegeria sp. HKCCD4884 TaxID=2683022 RepID=UPI001492699B|nr:gephyrin-like molybdotransferase Glp [Ruegeria sp. HKCCD4884]NOD94764.1 molybdopterin molybdenumtransferase MoeA [Ruegeria sp. HKCCD4884]
MADGCACDRHAHMYLSVEQALNRGLAVSDPLTDTETLPLIQAIGRVLAEDCTSKVDMPAFDNSAMDGYAVRTHDLGDDPLFDLPVGGRIAAGDSGAHSAPLGSALRIFTGAPVPSDFDAVLMQEDCDVTENGIRFARRPKPGQHIRRVGEDLKAGAPILRRGCEITAREAAALASAGYGAVNVVRKLKVTIFSTGSELKQPGDDLGPGQIYNSNRYMLRALLDKPWIDLTDKGPVEDDPALLEQVLRDACETSDLIITTGGVSVGDEDHMPRLFEAIGGRTEVMKVAMKPGKPIMFGRRGDALYVGLPGNPVSAYVTWQIIGSQMMARRAGLHRAPQVPEQAVLAEPLQRRAGRQEYRPVQIEGFSADGAPRLRLMAPSYSGRVALLAQADGLAVIPAETETMSPGQGLGFLRF